MAPRMTFSFLFRDDSIPDLENILDDSVQTVHENTAKLVAEQVSHYLSLVVMKELK